MAEELIFNIVSKIRDMLVIKSFGAQKWKEEDLKNFTFKLVEIYHRSRMEEGRDLDIATRKNDSWYLSFVSHSCARNYNSDKKNPAIKI